MALNRRLLQLGERIRVLVVDDSVVIRRLVTHALEEDPLIEVVGTASNGVIALQRVPQFNAYSERCRSAFRTDADRDSNLMPITIPK